MVRVKTIAQPKSIGLGPSPIDLGWVKGGNYTYLGIVYGQNRISPTQIGLAYWVGSKKLTQPIGMGPKSQPNPLGWVKISAQPNGTGQNLSPTQWYGSKSQPNPFTSLIYRN